MSGARDIDFRLLGPFEMRIGGRLLPLPSPKQRILVATLLLDVGRPVGTAELADAIWGTEQPERPRQALQLHVTRLRAELAKVSADRIISTRVDGYGVDAAVDQVDLGRFRLRLAEARRAGAGGDLAAQRAALTAALAQWRGEPLADVPSELLHQQAVPSLRDEWLRALESRMTLDLGLGRHSEMVGPLRELTARYPLHEPFWELLIRALDACGWRADALDVYHTARGRLADELGIEPGTNLRLLHARVLAGRGGGDGASAPAGPPQPFPVPRQLPADVLGFVGRAAEIARLDAVARASGNGADRGVRTVVVTGTAGVGKSALATRWARRAADDFPDGQLWADLRGYGPGAALTPERVLAGFVRALGMPGDRVPADPDDLVALYRSLLDGRRMLMVLDNAASAEQVRPLLPGGPGSAVVVTSRSELTGLLVEGARPVTVGLLNGDEARALLVARIGAARLRAHPRAVEEIIRRCSGLPLALAVVAARTAAHPHFGLDTLAAELRHCHGGLDALATDSPGSDVRTVFSWSIGAVSPAAARMFRLLGLHPGPEVSAPAAASLAGISVAPARVLLAELTRASLVAEIRPGRYRVHDLLHAYAAELVRSVDSAADRHAAAHRMFDHYLHTALTAAREYAPLQQRIDVPEPLAGTVIEDISSPGDAAGWFTANQAVWIALIDAAAAGGFAPYAWRLAWAINGFLYRRARWTDLEAGQRAALAAATRSGDRVGQANGHRGLAVALAMTGRYGQARAHFHDALARFRALDDPGGQALVHLGLAQVCGREGDHADALRHSRRAARLYRTAGHKVGYANALGAVAWMYTASGKHRETLSHSRRALTLLRELGDVRGQAGTLDTIGVSYHRLGDFSHAEEHLTRAAALFHTLTMPYYEADTLIHLGDARAAAGRATAARSAWRQALAALNGTEHPDAARIKDILG